MMTDEYRDPWRTDLAPEPPLDMGPHDAQARLRRDGPQTPLEPDARCQVCGAPHFEGDSILCAVCREPVLRCGWAP